jgi:hypothetical protein
MDKDPIDVAFAITVGMLAGIALLLVLIAGYFFPPFALFVLGGGFAGYLAYVQPEWIKKFWQQKEYRE